VPIPTTHASLLDDIRADRRRDEVWAVFDARYHGVILGWCVRRGLSLDEAEDLTQDVMLKLFQQLPWYTHDPDRGRFRNWLKTVVNNAIIDFWRLRERREERPAVGGTNFLDLAAGLASAGSGDLFSFCRSLLERIGLMQVIVCRTAIILADSLLDFSGVEQPLRLDDGLLAVDPLRFDRVQPRALARQPAGHDPYPTVAFHPPVVLLDPDPHPGADVPGGVVPDQQQRPFALRRQLPAHPGEELLGDLADRAALDEPQQHPAGVAAQHSITGQRLWVRVIAADRQLLEA
jgi:RNA polymerase sigma factor (sigma-70 family)